MIPTIEASPSSLKLSYLRFIADSSPGLALLFGLLVAETNNWLPFALTPKEAAPRAFAAVLAFLLATPIGLLINGMSHVLLGSIQAYVVRRCLASRVWPIANTHEGLRVRRWTKYFGITRRDWPRVADEVDDLLDTFAPHLSAKIDHVRALKRFCRSLALLALATIFILAGRHGAIAAGVLLGTLIIGVVLNTRDGSARTAALVVCSAETVLIGCWPDHVLAASALFAVALAAICFAGFFEFHQYAYVMLLLYQLTGKQGLEVVRRNSPLRLARDRSQPQSFHRNGVRNLTAMNRTVTWFLDHRQTSVVVCGAPDSAFIFHSRRADGHPGCDRIFPGIDFEDRRHVDRVQGGT